MKLSFFLSLIYFSHFTFAKNNDAKVKTANLFPVNIVQAITKFQNEINFLKKINKTFIDFFGHNLNSNSNQLYESFFMNYGSYNNQSHNISRSCIEKLDVLVAELKNGSKMAISGLKFNNFKIDQIIQL